MNTEPKWTPAPWVLKTRKDGSQYFSAGDPIRGLHEQWDIGGNNATNTLLTAALDLYHAVETAMASMMLASAIDAVAAEYDFSQPIAQAIAARKRARGDK